MSKSSAHSHTPAIVIFDVDGVIRDAASSHFRAMADTVVHFTDGVYCPTLEDIDILTAEGTWNNDWLASQELIYRYFEGQGYSRGQIELNYEALVEFFEGCYWGQNSGSNLGYVYQETLLVDRDYFDQLKRFGIPWGFFTGTTRRSASYVLESRLKLASPTIAAFEDGPGKPDPTNLLSVVNQLECVGRLDNSIPVIFVGDTTAEVETIHRSRLVVPDRKWLSIGVLPPHVQKADSTAQAYEKTLIEAGANVVLQSVKELTPHMIVSLVDSKL
ncbi:TIGR01548 family HAD-type hydrolase [Cyanobacteria bacterium FACHB-DQ100]|nr:TIGR01548 family HAD-type hydrolase [Cyanobacteria bacterium FACHB-DQ100]